MKLLILSIAGATPTKSGRAQLKLGSSNLEALGRMRFLVRWRAEVSAASCTMRQAERDRQTFDDRDLGDDNQA